MGKSLGVKPLGELRGGKGGGTTPRATSVSPVEKGRRTWERISYVPQGGEARDVWRVGEIRDSVKEVVAHYSNANAVLLADETITHYSVHSSQFDLAKAESLVPRTLASPLVVYVGNKARTLVFLGDYDDAHFVVVPVKTLKTELWQETLYVVTKTKLFGRGWNEKRVLYREGD